MLPAVATAGLAPPTRLPPISAQQLRLLVTALAGTLLLNVSGQSVGISVADIQGDIGASADEGSWLVTANTMALFCGIVGAPSTLAAFGLGRCMTAAALVFALAAAGCAASPGLPAMIALRALQGFASGTFGPIAFVATFMTMGGPRLPYGLSLLAFVLLLPGAFGPVAAGFSEAQFGWRGQFLIQAGLGVGVACAALLAIPHSPVVLGALRNDLSALVLLALALAATLLVLGQGTRRDWLDSPLIAASLAVAAGAWAGFLVTVARSPLPLLSLSLLATRGFLVPILLNLLFRAGFASTAFLIPQFLMIAQGYRPLELAPLFLWAAVPQVLAFPVTWWLLQRVDGRLVAASGLVLFGAGVLLAAGASGAAGADQIRPVLALLGAGQVLFLVPNLIAGGRLVTAAGAATASLMFNASTVGGTAIGVAATTELVHDRQAFHLAGLVEAAAAQGLGLDRIQDLGSRLAMGAGDDPAAGARAIAAVAGAAMREASVLALNDGYLLLGALLVASAAALPFLHPQPPLRPLLAL